MAWQTHSLQRQSYWEARHFCRFVGQGLVCFRQVYHFSNLKFEEERRKDSMEPDIQLGK